MKSITKISSSDAYYPEIKNKSTLLIGLRFDEDKFNEVIEELEAEVRARKENEYEGDREDEQCRSLSEAYRLLKSRYQ